MNYEQYQSGDSQSYETNELITTPYSTVEGEFTRVFGSSSQHGQSLGINMNSPVLVDGGLYYDPEKDKYKLFSWREIRGVDNMEAIERGMEPEASDADLVLSKTYVGNQKTYELISARVPEITDDSGDVLVEASSRARDFAPSDDGSLEFTEFEDLGGDKIPLGFDTISWYNGHKEYGPSASSKELAKMLTSLGEDIIEDENDLFNWLSDTTGENLLRDDLDGRDVAFFTVTETSDEGNVYHVPKVIDLNTGEEVVRNNRGGDSGNEQPSAGQSESDDSEELAAARERDAGSYPEPIADYIGSVRKLSVDEDRANTLLDELTNDSDNALTEEMIEDNGGRGEIIAQVI